MLSSIEAAILPKIRALAQVGVQVTSASSTSLVEDVRAGNLDLAVMHQVRMRSIFIPKSLTTTR
jgi:DNA-binding transcriptional LysR family regulator